MEICLVNKNILDIEAELLVCSANVSLNLTGGVGADIVTRYGTDMQTELHQILKDRTPHYATQGEVFTCHTKGLPYKAVLHAVAVDPMYTSSVEVITDIVRKCFVSAEAFDAKTVALTCLASGFGDLTLDDFMEGIAPLLKEDWQIKKVYLAQIQEYRFNELEEAWERIQI